MGNIARIYIRIFMFIAFNLQVMHDVQFVVTEITGNYLVDVLQVLESCSAEVLDLVKQSILQAKKSLEDCLPAVMDTMIEAIVKKSVEVSGTGGVITFFGMCEPFLYSFFLLLFFWWEHYDGFWKVGF